MKSRNVTCDLAPITCECAPTTLIAWSRHVAIRACIPITSAHSWNKERTHSVLRSGAIRPRLVVQVTCLQDEIIKYNHSVVDPVATETVDRRFRTVIE